MADFNAAYAELEGSVRDLMMEWCGEACGLCTVCCCRADICEEAARSAFLSLLLGRQGLTVPGMDDRYGWLDLHGCLLEYGRPPVCYAYFCEELLNDLPDEETRHVIHTLGRLLHHVGEEAMGERHLVEIVDPAELDRIDCSALFRRLAEARAALKVIESFTRNDRLTEADQAVLGRITANDP